MIFLQINLLLINNNNNNNNNFVDSLVTGISGLYNPKTMLIFESIANVMNSFSISNNFEDNINQYKIYASDREKRYFSNKSDFTIPDLKFDQNLTTVYFKHNGVIWKLSKTVNGSN